MSGAPSPEEDNTARITFRAVFTYLIVEVDKSGVCEYAKKDVYIKEVFRGVWRE